MSARSSLIAAVSVLALLSTVWAIIGLSSPQDSGGLGGDSYGNRHYGHKAFHDLLAELDVPVSRSAGLPGAGDHSTSACLVFWNPDSDLVATEPDYLSRVRKLAGEGALIVVAPSRDEPREESRRERREKRDAGRLELTSATEALGIHGLRLLETKINDTSGVLEFAAPHKPSKPSPDEDEMDPRPKKPELVTLDVTCDGQLAPWTDKIRHLALPRHSITALEESTSETAAGRLWISDGHGGKRLLAALYPRRKGSVIVVSEPLLLSNAALEQADNSVLAMELVGGGERPVIFEEFYHNLMRRGNPAVVLTRHPFGLVAALLLLAVGLWAWREGVPFGAPLKAQDARRRSITEYVEAMAALFRRSNCRQFVLREVLDGVIWQQRRKLHLSTGHEDVEAIVAALERRDPEAAKRFKYAVARAEACLDKPRWIRKKQMEEIGQELSRCL